MANEGKTSKTYRSAVRTTVPPPTARSGRRPTSLVQLFMRVSVLLVSISHPLCAPKKPLQEGRPRRGAGYRLQYQARLGCWRRDVAGCGGPDCAVGAVTRNSDRKISFAWWSAQGQTVVGGSRVARPPAFGFKFGLIYTHVRAVAHPRTVEVGGCRSVSRVAHTGGDLCLALLLDVERDGDGRKNPDDEHYDEELDEGETSLFPTHLLHFPKPLGEKVKHTLSPYL